MSDLPDHDGMASPADTPEPKSRIQSRDRTRARECFSALDPDVGLWNAADVEVLAGLLAEDREHHEAEVRRLKAEHKTELKASNDTRDMALAATVMLRAERDHCREVIDDQDNEHAQQMLEIANLRSPLGQIGEARRQIDERDQMIADRDRTIVDRNKTILELSDIAARLARAQETP